MLQNTARKATRHLRPRWCKNCSTTCIRTAVLRADKKAIATPQMRTTVKAKTRTKTKRFMLATARPDNDDEHEMTTAKTTVATTVYENPHEDGMSGLYDDGNDGEYRDKTRTKTH